MILVVVTAYIAKVPAAALVALGSAWHTGICSSGSTWNDCVLYDSPGEKSAAAIQAAKSSSFVNDMIKFAKQAVSSKEMWLMVIAGIICIILVYTIRRAAMAHAWKAASVAGALAYLIVAAAGGSVLSVKTSTTTLFVGAVVAVVTGLVLEIIFFAVDYSKCESLQFEDDEYYYYVKQFRKWE